jgi:hypothetical protein
LRDIDRSLISLMDGILCRDVFLNVPLYIMRMWCVPVSPPIFGGGGAAAEEEISNDACGGGGGGEYHIMPQQMPRADMQDLSVGAGAGAARAAPPRPSMMLMTASTTRTGSGCEPCEYEPPCTDARLVDVSAAEVEMVDINHQS